MKLGKLRDGALDRIRIDEIGETAHGLFLDAIKPAGGAIALQGSNVSGEPRLDKAHSDLVEREGIACRGRSRCVAGIMSGFVGHCRQCTIDTRTTLWISPSANLGNSEKVGLSFGEQCVEAGMSRLRRSRFLDYVMAEKM
jgi:hypothetical protein